MVGNQRQGWAISPRWACCLLPGSPSATGRSARQSSRINSARCLQPGGNMEGKEVRFGIAAPRCSPSQPPPPRCGAVNAMHDSFTAARRHDSADQHAARRNIFGGVGAGMYGMLLFVIAGGFRRRPDGGPYAGICRQKDRSQGSQDGDACHPDPAVDVSRLDRRGGVYPTAVASMANPDRTVSPRCSNYTSQTGNNGSAFAGLTGNILLYNLTGAIAMMIGRFWMIIPAMAIAGSLAAKRSVPASVGTFPTTGGLFVGLTGRRDPHRRWPYVFSGSGARPACRAHRDDRRHPLLIDPPRVTSMESTISREAEAGFCASRSQNRITGDLARPSSSSTRAISFQTR